MRAAIDVLPDQPAPRLLVMGDMGETGTQATEFHREVGDYARSRGIEHIWTVGNDMQAAAAAAGERARQWLTVDARRTCNGTAGSGQRAGQRVPLHEDGAHRPGLGSPGHARRRTLMLLLLTQWLSNEYRLFSVFNYLTLRAALATLTALFIVCCAGRASSASSPP